jgi:hypothetical protein
MYCFYGMAATKVTTPTSFGDTYDTGDALHTLAILPNIDKKGDRASFGSVIRK